MAAPALVSTSKTTSSGSTPVSGRAVQASCTSTATGRSRSNRVETSYGPQSMTTPPPESDESRNHRLAGWYSMPARLRGHTVANSRACTSPSTPLASTPLTASVCGSPRNRVLQVPKRTPAVSAAASIPSASSTVMASGFSQSTARPLRAAATAVGAWNTGGVATTTTSSGAAGSAASIASAEANPTASGNCVRKSSSTAGVGSATRTSTRTPRGAAAATCVPAITPAPMRYRRMAPLRFGMWVRSHIRASTLRAARRSSRLRRRSAALAAPRRPPARPSTSAGSELVDVAVRTAEVLPRRARLAEQLDACRAQLLHGGRKIGDGEADDGPGRQVLLARVAGAEHLHVPPVGQGIDPEAGLHVRRPQAEHVLVEGGELRVPFAPRAHPTESCDPHDLSLGPPGRRRAPGSTRGALQHELPDPRRVRLAAHRLHDGADHGTGGLHLAVADLLQHVGLRGEGLVDGGEQRAVVGDDREAARLHDVLGRALARDHALEHLAGEPVGQLARLDERDQLGDVQRRDQRSRLDPARVRDP